VVVGLEAELWNGFKLMETRQFVAKVNYSRSRVRSTTDGILSAWHATSRWQGEFTIPVSALWAQNRR